MNAQATVEAHGIYAALANAQAKLSAPTKNREVSVRMKQGGTYKFKYATLDHLIEHVRGPLTENGLWFVQRTEQNQMITRITHASGEYIESAVPMPNLPNAPQEAGSVLTYFRRYSLSIALGLSSDEDDDANVAEGNGYTAKEGKSAPPPAAISDDTRDRIIQLCEAVGGNQSAAICKAYNVESIADLTPEQGDAVISRLTGKLAEKAKAETNAKAKEPV